MLSKIIPDASLKSDSALKADITRRGIRNPFVTASLAVASVGVLILPIINASGKLTSVSRCMLKPLTIKASKTMIIVSPIISLIRLPTL